MIPFLPSPSCLSPYVRSSVVRLLQKQLVSSATVSVARWFRFTFTSNKGLPTNQSGKSVANKPHHSLQMRECAMVGL